MLRQLESLVRAALAVSLIGAGGGVATAAEAGAPIVKVVELNSWYSAILVDRGATRNPRDLEALAKPLCEGKTVCRVGVWTDQWTMPNGMPVGATQLDAQEYSFGRNAKGEETSLWNCNKYPEFEAENACMTRILAR